MHVVLGAGDLELGRPRVGTIHEQAREQVVRLFVLERQPDLAAHRGVAPVGADDEPARHRVLSPVVNEADLRPLAGLDRHL